jgi:hypothetical protein
MSTDLVCEYCGRAQGDRLTCCGEHHWVPAFDWRKEDRDWEGITARIDAAIENDELTDDETE